MIVFRDYILPFRWGDLKVTGLACTCPDERIVSGELYLRFITPDSLRNFEIDYSEVFVTEAPHTRIDPMGVDYYIIEGSVIGKRRIYENDPWNLVVKVDNWKEVDLRKDWGIKILLLVELVVFGLLLKLIRTKMLYNHH